MIESLQIMVDGFARDRVTRAREFATFAHDEQRYGDKPYVHHLIEVRNIVLSIEVEPLSFSATERATIALLHDILEDTSVTLEMLEQAFGYHVARQVDLISDGPGPNRKERKATTYERLRALHHADHDALIVKAADRLGNVRNAKANSPGLLKMYRKEHAAFEKAVRRKGLITPVCTTSIWDELETLISP